MSTPKQKIIFSLFILSTFVAALLAACSGQTLIDVNIDPTTGSGNIVVNPPPQATPIPETGAQPPSDMSQVALFAIIVILLLGVMAIVFSVARRPRGNE
jgi:hypothetical protein